MKSLSAPCRRGSVQDTAALTQQCGVFHTNCIVYLDRTNVLQLVLAQHEVDITEDQAPSSPSPALTINRPNIVCPKVAERSNLSAEPTPEEPSNWLVIRKVVCYTAKSQMGYNGTQSLIHLLVGEGLA
ncbi:hypothetical protein EGR_03515 [Echinococcus granulosus]|uniref:SAC domain-containing protein n=1 Tax=Echinococcus granulosus TaxID=6210 RepID=W6UKL0_ECHGR|nr:hypothetical protein EGR_03515 [Echinococcus granulosus]EUB61701.1 hypothetical protein EGR_03515 [Echinococcus granulosus]